LRTRLPIVLSQNPRNPRHFATNRLLASLVPGTFPGVTLIRRKIPVFSTLGDCNVAGIDIPNETVLTACARLSFS
jgi:hypothetical protein